MVIKKITFIILFLSLTLLFFSMNSKDKNIVEDRIIFLNDKIPTTHPRLYILKNELEDFRNFFNEKKKDTKLEYIFKDAILDKFNLPFYPEPERLLTKHEDAESAKKWRDAYTNAFKNAITAQHYAFSYLVTGDKKYAKEAIKWLLYIASWNIAGGIDIKNNDEAFIQSLRPFIIAYDWIYDELTNEDKKKLESALNIRLKILFDHVTSLYLVSERLPVEKNESHKMRFISTVGLGGLALYHELKDAPIWFAWAYEYYNRQFPAWGGKDGGYSEGLNYWTTGHNQHFMFLEAVKALKLTELFTRDYYKNNGYFAMYNVLPFTYSSFGDLCNTLSPDEYVAMHIEKYALIYNDPYLKKFHEIIFKKYPSKLEYYNYSFFDTIFHLYRKKDFDVQSEDLKKLPRSRCFYDVGWVAMHSELGTQNDIMLGFKSSPYGSASHSFADQNSFVINAFGGPLAISSGYREWYDSPHHIGWTRTTASKNAVLFNKQGQRIKDATANGKIVAFYTTENFDFTTGDAKNAFDPLVGVVKNLRTVLFVNKEYFIIFDELENKYPLSHQWLLHSKEKFFIDEKNKEVTTKNQNAELFVKFILPTKDLKLSQTDQFAVPVDKEYLNRYKNEYHFTLDAFKKEKSREFVVFLMPQLLEKKKDISIARIDSKNGYVINCSLGERKDTILLGKTEENLVETDNFLFKGRALVLSKERNFTKVFAVNALSFKDNEIYFETEPPLTFEANISKEGLKLEIKCDKKTDVKFKIDFQPKSFIGTENFIYDGKKNIISFSISEDSIIYILP